MGISVVVVVGPEVGVIISVVGITGPTVVVNSSGASVVGSAGEDTACAVVDLTGSVLDSIGNSVDGSSVGSVGNAVLGSGSGSAVRVVNGPRVGFSVGNVTGGTVVVVVVVGDVGLGLTHRLALSTVTKSNNFRHIKSQEQTV